MATTFVSIHVVRLFIRNKGEMYMIPLQTVHGCKAIGVRRRRGKRLAGFEVDSAPLWVDPVSVQRRLGSNSS